MWYHHYLVGCHGDLIVLITFNYHYYSIVFQDIRNVHSDNTVSISYIQKHSHFVLIKLRKLFAFFPSQFMFIWIVYWHVSFIWLSSVADNPPGSWLSLLEFLCYCDHYWFCTMTRGVLLTQCYWCRKSILLNLFLSYVVPMATCGCW